MDWSRSENYHWGQNGKDEDPDRCCWSGRWWLDRLKEAKCIIWHLNLPEDKERDKDLLRNLRKQTCPYVSIPEVMRFMLRRSNVCLSAGPSVDRPSASRFFNSFMNVAWFSFHPAYKRNPSHLNLAYTIVKNNTGQLTLWPLREMLTCPPLGKFNVKFRSQSAKEWASK